MKYKLLKNTPVHKAGLICQEGLRDGANMSILYPVGSCDRICMVEDITDEWFAPFLFQTIDGVDIYKGDSYWYIWKDNPCRKETINTPYFTKHAVLDKGDKWADTAIFFSTKEAAQSWITEMNKPKFVEGEWLYFDNSDFYGIMRYGGQFDETFSTSKEQYYINKKTNVIVDDGIGHYYKDWITKAISTQVQDILSKVALHKGFKEGVRFKSAYSGNEYTANQPDFKYNKHSDGLYNNSAIYWQGKWAEIIKEEIPIVIPQDYPCVYTKVIAPNTLSVNLLGSGYEVTSVGFDKNEVKINYQVK